MLAAALKAEADAYVDALVEQLDEDGHRLVVRNGHREPRAVTTAAGAIEVRAPRVNDKRVDEPSGERMRFASAILPAWCRRSPKIGEVLPLLYLHGLSGGDFVPALEQFLGTGAGLSASTITRLCEQWQDEQRLFAKRALPGVDYVYVWADGIHVNIRLEEHKLCLLVLIGVRADGSKELITLSDGSRESVESWADLLRGAKLRGMRAPVLAVGDGALGFWGGLREVFPDTKEQRCWFHKGRKRARCDAQVRAPGRAQGPRRDLGRGGQDPREGRGENLRRAVRGRSFRRRSRRSPTTSSSCSPSTTTPPNTGSTCARRTQSSPPSPPSGTAPRSPADPAPKPPAWRWPTSSSSPPKTAGAPSTRPTSSTSSAPAQSSSTVNSSNEQTIKNIRTPRPR